jgi:hypothetical protein
MLVVILAYLGAVGLLMFGYTLVWLLSPQARAWMEAPRDRFLEYERRFPRVVHDRLPQADIAILACDVHELPTLVPANGPTSENKLLHLLKAYSDHEAKSEQAALRDLLIDLRCIAGERGLDFSDALTRSKCPCAVLSPAAFDSRI